MKKVKSFSHNKVSCKTFTLKKDKSARKQGYDSNWDKYRFRFLHYNPHCYVCGKKATVVDHIVAHKGKEELFKATTNHMPLCKECHNYITGKFDRVDNPDVAKKAEWIKLQREQNVITNKIKILERYQK